MCPKQFVCSIAGSSNVIVIDFHSLAQWWLCVSSSVRPLGDPLVFISLEGTSGFCLACFKWIFR